MKPSNKAIAAIVTGSLLIVAAAAGWKYWEIDGVIAVIVGGCGLTMVCSAVDEL